jgi:hypothetical protein
MAAVAVVGAGCGGSSATWPGATTGNNGNNGGTAAPTVNPNNPETVIDHVLGGASAMAGGDQTIKYFHIKVALNGTLLASALNSMAGSSGSTTTIKNDVKLDGTAIEGDIDVVKQAAKLDINVPATVVGGLGLDALLGSAKAITGQIIVADKAAYIQLPSLLGNNNYMKYDMSDVGDLTSGLGVSVPTAGPSILSSVEAQVADIRKQLDAAGMKTTLVGTEKIGGKDAYHINISVPVAEINKQIGAASSPDPAPLKVDTASFDVWAYTDSYNLAQVELKGSSSGLGTLDLVVTVTNYDKAVSISAPPASQVSTPGA